METHRVRVTPVVSTELMYFTTSSTGSTGDLQDINMTVRLHIRYLSIQPMNQGVVPQGVFVWQFANAEQHDQWAAMSDVYR